jgi:hypothetical protein
LASERQLQTCHQGCSDLSMNLVLLTTGFSHRLSINKRAAHLVLAEKHTVKFTSRAILQSKVGQTLANTTSTASLKNKTRIPTNDGSLENASIIVAKIQLKRAFQDLVIMKIIELMELISLDSIQLRSKRIVTQ